MRLSHLTSMAGLKTTRMTSLNKKRKKKSVSSRYSGNRLQTLKLPEWNTSINNHAYGLSRDELIRRREQRISKNLAAAQVELYDRIGQTGPSKQRARSASPVMMGRGETIQKSNNDLGQLLRRSEDLLVESRQLLGETSVPLQRNAAPDFTNFRHSANTMPIDKGDIQNGEVNMDYAQYDLPIENADLEDPDACYLAGIFEGLRVEDPHRN